MSGPTFSVIIAVHNGGRTIARAIESVFEQSAPAHEVIVVDDGSTDDTGAIVARYGSKVRYFRQQNGGVSSARNAGARAAAGAWLAFLDADDWYYRGRLHWHAEWIARDGRLDFLTGDYEYRNADGSLISRSMEVTAAGRAMLAKAAGRREVTMESREMTAFIEHHFGDTHTLSVPRATFLQLGGYPVGRAVCEDVNLLIRLCAKSRRVGVVCEPMGVYCVHPDSATRRDPLRSQQLTVEALLPLERELRDAPRYVYAGYLGRLRRARLNLAYALLRNRRGLEALRAVMPSVWNPPRSSGIRDVASIAWSLVRRSVDAPTSRTP